MLELINITKKYDAFTAVDNISFTVKDGEVLGLLGPNGAGKSTMVSMISTVKSPTNGDIRVDGHLLSKEPLNAKKVMGIVPQDIALYEDLSTKENLEFFGCLYGLSRSEIKKRTVEVLDIIELSDKQNQSISKFSGGMKRRANIGVALMNNPKLLLLDEPTVGIDPQSRNHILETVKRLNQERGMTVIYTSHYMEEVEFLCKRIAIVDHGKLIALGTKEELKETLSSRDTLSLTIGSASITALDSIKQITGVENITTNDRHISMLVDPQLRNALDIMDEIRHLGISITSFKYEEVNLENIFLQATGKSLRE